MPSNINRITEVLRTLAEAAAHNLELFMDYVRLQLPESAPEIEKQLTCYFLGCVEVVEQAMIGNGCLASKAEAVSQLNQQRLRDLFCAFHTSHVILTAFGETDERFAQVYLDGTSALYDKPPTYADGWIQFLLDNQDPEYFNARLMYRRYDEIAIIMHEPINDPIEALYWGNVLVDVAICAKNIYDSSGD